MVLRIRHVPPRLWPPADQGSTTTWWAATPPTLGRPTKRPPARKHLARFVADADRRHLVDAMAVMTPDDMDHILRTLPRPAAPRIPEPVPLPESTRDRSILAALRSRTGAIETVLLRQYTLPVPDNLGNKTRWQCDLESASWTPAAGWTDPIPIPWSEMYVFDSRLREAPDGTLWLFVLGHNIGTEPTSFCLEPKRWDIRASRRLPGARGWTPFEGCLPVVGESLMIGGFDAAFSAGGDLHIVWVAWDGNGISNPLRHRVLCPSSWSSAETLPVVPGRNFSKPRLLIQGDSVHVLVPGQTFDYNRIGLYHSSQGPEGWDDFELVEDGTSFDTSVSPDGPILGVGAWPPTGSALLLYSILPSDKLASFGRRAFPDTKLSQYPGMHSIARRPGDPATYTALWWQGNLLLVRLPDAGEPEAICLLPSRPDRAAPHRAWLLLAGEDYDVLYGEGPMATRLFHLHGSLPERGWRSAPSARAANSAGSGLSQDDRSFLRTACLAQARELEAQGKARAAAERYLYLLAGFREGTELGVSIDALKRLGASSPREVAASLATATVDYPGAFRVSGAQALLAALLAHGVDLAPCPAPGATP